MPAPSADEWVQWRLERLRRITCGGLLGGMLLSPRLWWGGRDFPTVSLVPGLLELPVVLSSGLSVLLALGLVAFMLYPGRAVLVVMMVCLGILIFFDVTRLQPWVYLYGLLLLPLSGRSAFALRICAFSIAATYFWSGVQKLNVGFFEEVFPWLMRPLVGDAAEAMRPLAYGVPFVESAIGVLLLVPRTRNAGVIGALLMHTFLLATLGLAHGYNSVVWPWNLAMAMSALVVFAGTRESVLPELWARHAGRGAIALLGVLPALNFVGLWDDYLSASLYSGRPRHAFVLLNDEQARRLPVVGPLPTFMGGRQLDLSRWAMKNLNVPPYPEPRVYRRIAEEVSHRVGGRPRLFIRERPTLAGRPPPYVEELLD